MRRMMWMTSVVFGAAACFGMLPGDTQGVQQRAEWWSDAQLSVVLGSVLGLEHIEVSPGAHDVVVGRFDFDPAVRAFGDEFSVSFGIDLGPADSLALRVKHPLGGPDGLGSYLGARISLGPTLVADSMRGTLLILSRGMMQMVGRIDAELFYSSLTDPSRVEVQPFKQRVDFLRPAERTPRDGPVR